MSTTDHLFVLQELIFYYRFDKRGPRGGTKLPLYLCFLDLKKAFDTVPRQLLFQKLSDFGISGKMLRVIIDLYSQNMAKVLIDGYFSREFTITNNATSACPWLQVVQTQNTSICCTPYLVAIVIAQNNQQ